MGRRRRTHRHLPARMRESHGAFYYVPTVNGKQVWHYLSRDYGDALAKYRQFVAPKTDDNGGTVADMIERFLRESLPSRAANTQRSYRSWSKRLRDVFGKMHVEDITQRYARQYRDRHPKKVTAQRELSLLKTMLADAVEWGWLDANPLLGFRKLSEGHRHRYITDAEWSRLLEHAGHIRPLLVLAYYTGMRKSDLCALTWGCVQGDMLRTTTGKTGARMAWRLDTECMAALATLRGHAAPFPKLPVFRSKTGARLTDRNLDNYWWQVCERASVEGVVFHDIRRKRITDLGENYGREFAQRWASHADAKTTAGYMSAPETVVELPSKEAPLIPPSDTAGNSKR